MLPIEILKKHIRDKAALNAEREAELEKLLGRQAEEVNGVESVSSLYDKHGEEQKQHNILYNEKKRQLKLEHENDYTASRKGMGKGKNKDKGDDLER